MRKPAIKYSNYKEDLGDGWILEQKLLMDSIVWTIYRYEFMIGSDSGTNIDNEPHPGYMERYTKFWSNCSNAEEEALALAQELMKTK